MRKYAREKLQCESIKLIYQELKLNVKNYLVFEIT